MGQDITAINPITAKTSDPISSVASDAKVFQAVFRGGSLRLLHEQDVWLIQQLYQSHRVMRFVGPLYSDQAILKLFQNCLNANSASPPAKIYMVIETATAPVCAFVELPSEPVPTDLAGLVAIANINYQERSAELGIMVRPESQAQGLTQRAFSAMIDHLFEQLNFQMVVCYIHPENLAALHLAKKLAMLQVSMDERGCRFERYAQARQLSQY